MKNEFVKKLSDISLCLLIGIIMSVPYCFIAFHQLHVDFRLWTEPARTLFCVIGVCAFFMTLGVLLKDEK